MTRLIRLFFVFLLAANPLKLGAADSIKIALIDALSGPYAELGFATLRQYQEVIAHANSNGGALGLKLEIVPLDDQSTVEQALGNLQLAIRQGIRYVSHGNNPQVALALAEAIDHHNRENPGRTVLFLDVGDGAPQLDNEQCSFWHFRFDAGFEMKLRTLLDGIPEDGSIKTVYLLNQDDPWGHYAGRETLRLLNEKRPEIQVVGDDVHPLGKVKDFSGYLAKIRDSGADAIVTADRGADLVGIMKAAAKSGGEASIFVLSNWVSAAPAAIGEQGENRVTGGFTWHANVGSSLLDLFSEDYRSKHGEDWNGLALYVAIQMLVTSMETARSTDPLQVAVVLEGLSFLGANGPTAMRDDNHQLLQPLFLATLTTPGDGTGHTAAGAKLGWQTVLRKEPDETWLDSVCKMERPEGVKRR